jgi:hypothetical protein
MARAEMRRSGFAMRVSKTRRKAEKREGKSSSI